MKVGLYLSLGIRSVMDYFLWFFSVMVVATLYLPQIYMVLVFPFGVLISAFNICSA